MLKGLKSFYHSYRTQLIIFIIALPYIIAQNLHGGDFRILLTASGYLARGTMPYGIVMPIEGGTTDVLLYSPFVVFVLMPLTYLPEFIPTFIFSLFNFFILFRIWSIMGRWLQIENLTTTQRKWWYIITIFFMARFIMHNFENSQMNIVVLYLSLEGLHQILLRGKSVGGLLLGLGICLKVLPVVFIPYLVYRKKIGAVFAVILSATLLLLLPTAWFGLSYEIQLLQGWWAAINPTLDKYNAEQNVGVQFHCISALIPVYFSNISYKGFSVNVLSLNPSQLFLVINAVRLSLVCFTLYFLCMGPPTQKRNALFLFWELAYIFLLIPLIFPHQAKYSYFNLLPAFGYIAYYFVNIYTLQSLRAKKDKARLLLCLVLVAILIVFTADIFWGMSFGKYFQFLKLITVGTLLLIPALAFFSPKRLYDTLAP